MPLSDRRLQGSARPAGRPQMDDSDPKTAASQQVCLIYRGRVKLSASADDEQNVERASAGDRRWEMATGQRLKAKG